MRGSEDRTASSKRTSLPATLNATADYIFANAVTGPSGNGGMKLANVRVSGDLWPILYATASRDDVVVSYLCAFVSLMRVLTAGLHSDSIPSPLVDTACRDYRSHGRWR
jgi:hypothetical protein